MNITQVSEFGKHKYLHETIDTYSGYIWNIAVRSLQECYCSCVILFVMDMPKIIKTENDPGYMEKKFQSFCKSLSILHKTGIPYNPQAQSIVEHAHQTLKNMIQILQTKQL